jgi:hypothetical protein
MNKIGHCPLYTTLDDAFAAAWDLNAPLICGKSILVGDRSDNISNSLFCSSEV